MAATADPVPRAVTAVTAVPVALIRTMMERVPAVKAVPLAKLVKAGTAVLRSSTGPMVTVVLVVTAALAVPVARAVSTLTLGASREARVAPAVTLGLVETPAAAPG